jgi:hypothetical protein
MPPAPVPRRFVGGNSRPAVTWTFLAKLAWFCNPGKKVHRDQRRGQFSLLRIKIAAGDQMIGH